MHALCPGTYADGTVPEEDDLLKVLFMKNAAMSDDGFFKKKLDMDQDLSDAINWIAGTILFLSLSDIRVSSVSRVECVRTGKSAVEVNDYREYIMSKIESAANEMISNGECDKWFTNVDPTVIEVCARTCM